VVGPAEVSRHAQILTVAELFAGKQPKLPWRDPECVQEGCHGIDRQTGPPAVLNPLRSGD
jgi:hypothetical protein